MGHHLLNGVKCVREVRGLTNALIISPWTGEECAGGEVMTRHRADVINYHRGASETTRSRLTAAIAQRDVLSCVQTITGNLDRNSELPFLLHSHFQTRKGGKCPFSP